MRVRKPSPSMAVAVVALVLAASGTTLAASHYLITSRSQIKPSVLRSLAAPARVEVNEANSLWALAKPGIPVVWARAQCPEGTHVLSGGYEANLAPGVTIESDRAAGNGWSVVAFNSTDSSALGETRLRVHALCLAGTP